MLEGERVAALPENDQLRGTLILVTDRRGDAWTTTQTDVEATPRSWSPIPAGRAGEPTRNGVSNAAGRNTLPRPGYGTVRPAVTAQRRLTFLTMSNFGVKNARCLHPSYVRA